jgi:FtsZ-binding cell division protein ZapB
LTAEIEKNAALTHRVGDLTHDNSCLNEENTKLRDDNNVKNAKIVELSKVVQD